MKYKSDDPFIVPALPSQAYRDNWERIFKPTVDQLLDPPRPALSANLTDFERSVLYDKARQINTPLIQSILLRLADAVSDDDKTMIDLCYDDLYCAVFDNKVNNAGRPE